MLAVESQATLRVRAPLKQAAAALRAPLPELPAGTRFGAWAIDRLIGAGGMGQVYLGHRADGAYEREVAIKLVAADALDAQGRALFEFECRLLAQMVHPAIAQIHDVGTDAHGQPYLVMEYLRGEPITWWCDEHRLSLHARVLLMLRVSEAVQHAHQKGVIHRDLKPSNVLVSEIDGRPMPGVIDFGIAVDATNPAMTYAHDRGTPGYMSPEQARGARDHLPEITRATARRAGCDRAARPGTATGCALRIGICAPGRSASLAGRLPAARPAGEPLAAAAQVHPASSQRRRRRRPGCDRRGRRPGCHAVVAAAGRARCATRAGHRRFHEFGVVQRGPRGGARPGQDPDAARDAAGLAACGARAGRPARCAHPGGTDAGPHAHCAG
nr:serine/threonine-protein kinase [Xanthomonas citri]